jgi:hypothetical protein
MHRQQTVIWSPHTTTTNRVNTTSWKGHCLFYRNSMKSAQLLNRAFSQCSAQASDFEIDLEEHIHAHGSNSIMVSSSPAESFQDFDERFSSPTSVSQERLVASMQSLSVLNSPSDPWSTSPVASFVDSKSELHDAWSMPPHLIRVTTHHNLKGSKISCPRPSDPVAKFLNSQC